MIALLFISVYWWRDDLHAEPKAPKILKICIETCKSRAEVWLCYWVNQQQPVPFASRWNLKHTAARLKLRLKVKIAEKGSRLQSLMRAVDGLSGKAGFGWRHLHSPSIEPARLSFSISGHRSRENGCQWCLSLEGGTFQCRILGLCKQQTVNISLYQPAWRPSAPEGSIPQDGWFLTLISEWWRQNKSDKLASF